jgi:phosphoribosylformylglycinamidine synthase PurS subunit
VPLDYVAKVYVMPKPAILDPQGKAVATSLHALGYQEVGDVRLGKCIVVRLTGSDRTDVGRRVEEMCRRLLANDVIEDFEFELEELSR